MQSYNCFLGLESWRYWLEHATARENETENTILP